MYDEAAPDPVREFAEQAVAYVQAALHLELAYDSDTLPLMDHYLRNVPDAQKATVALVAATAGAYFGEVVRRQLGGEWELDDDDGPLGWRLHLPSGMSFAPAGVVAAVIARSDELDVDSALDAAPAQRPQLEAILARMGDVTEDEYYSLCGRFDTLEHVEEVLLAIKAARQQTQS